MSVLRAELDKLRIEEGDAWFEYLDRTTGLTVLEYREREPWAWEQLEARLASIRERRKRLKGAGAIA